MAQPPALPGYHYDPTRQKYFRIQPNHLASITDTSKYTTQSVSALTLQNQEASTASSRTKFLRQNRVQFSPYLTITAGRILYHQIGISCNTSTRSIVQDAYLQNLRPRTVSHGLKSDAFAICPTSKALFTQTQVTGGWEGERRREICFTPPVKVSIKEFDGEDDLDSLADDENDEVWNGFDDKDEHNAYSVSTVDADGDTAASTATARQHNRPEEDLDSDSDSDNYDESLCTTYSRQFTIPIYSPQQSLQCIEPVSEGLVIWATKPSTEHHHHNNSMTWNIATTPLPVGVYAEQQRQSSESKIYISRKRDWGWPGEEYGEWGTSQIELDQSMGLIWDLKARSDGEKVVMASERGMNVCDVEKGVAGGVWEMNAVGKLRRECMCVAWKSENVVVGGTRTGEVWLGDIRVDGGAVRRARCPWGVSAVRRMVDSERLLAWGLEGGCVLDLRLTKSLSAAGNYTAGRHNAKGQGLTTTTAPAVVFDVPESLKQKRYRLGWEFDAEMGIVLSAGTDLYRTHKVGIWDVRTGRKLKKGILASHTFSKPVTCIQMVDLEQRGGVKTLLTASDGRIEAWEV